jgi:hypothetical protein
MSYNNKLKNYILNYVNTYNNDWNSISSETNVFTISGSDDSIIYVAGTTNIIQIHTKTNEIFLLNNPSIIPLTIIATNGDGSVIVATNGINIFKSNNYGASLTSQQTLLVTDGGYRGLALDSTGNVQSSTFASNTGTSGGVINYGIPSFVTNITIEVNVTTGVVTLPIVGILDSVSINWGDGITTIETNNEPTYTYESPGLYKIQISGIFHQFASSNIMSDYNTGLSSFVYNINIPSLTSMSNAFANVYTDFNVDFGNNTSNVTDMSGMFYNCKYFNSYLKNIDTSSVTNMSRMFHGAVRFNRNLKDLVTTNVRIMDYMFYNCQNFNQDLSGFQIPNLISAKNMIINSYLSTENYDLLLISFNNQGLSNSGIQINVMLGVGNVKYSARGQPAHDNLIRLFNWKISDGGFAYCFNTGTKILILENNEEIYKNIEELVEGTLVKTYANGYKKIVNIVRGVFNNDIYNSNKCMYRMNKSGDMIEDLLITGSHSILVDELSEEERNNMTKVFGKLKKIEDKYLLLSCFSNKLEKIKSKDFYEYYNIKLEGNDCGYGIYANGILCESYNI